MKHRSSKKMHKPKSFCQCFHGFAGPGCKMQVWIGFQNPSSYLAFRNWPAAVSNDQKNTRNVTLSLRTLGRSRLFIRNLKILILFRNGVLLYHGDENAFVALELYQGRVKGTFYAGNYPPSHLYSYVMGYQLSHLIDHLIL
jgi:hypothetical protein